MGDGIPMDKIRNLSVRKTILLYMAAALLGSFIFSAVIVRIAGQTQRQIWWDYVDEEAYFEAVENEGPYYVADIPRPGAYEMTRSDYFVSELCDFLQTYTVLVLSMAGSCGAVFLFYRNKLKMPCATNTPEAEAASCSGNCAACASQSDTCSKTAAEEIPAKGKEHDRS